MTPVTSTSGESWIDRSDHASPAPGVHVCAAIAPVNGVTSIRRSAGSIAW
jgi:hypothetical protein